METIRKDTIASVTLFTSRLSEDEIAAFQEAITYSLDTLDDRSLEQRFGASRDELEGIRDDLREALAGLKEPAREPEPVA